MASRQPAPSTAYDALLRGTSDHTDGVVEPAGVRLTRIITELAEAGLTVATAESLTGGLLAAALTSVPGSSAVVRGGLIVYATDLKRALAGVDAGLLDQRGPIDPDVAVALAEGARRRCAADIGIGLTGVAGPDPQDGKPPGTWYVAMVGPGGVRTSSSPASAAPGSAPPETDRQQIRADAVDAALRLLDTAREHSSRPQR